MIPGVDIWTWTSGSAPEVEVLPPRAGVKATLVTAAAPAKLVTTSAPASLVE
jgi:hypothetical protein